MEQSGHVLPRAENFFIKNTDSFEKELKDRLRWNKQRWSEAGETNSRLNKLCNSLHFWKSRLKPAVEDVSIIVTLFNKDNDVRVGLVEIIEAIESLNSNFIVKGIARFRNPRYVCLYFANKEIRDSVKEAFRMLNENFVVYLSWALKEDSNVSKLTVHWLPLTLNTDIVKQKLEKYVNCIEEERKNLVFMSGREMPSERIEFKVSYKKDVTTDMVPHLIEINSMEALITISGRRPLCLNCDRLGHISKECDLRFCTVCRVLKKKEHVCDNTESNRSYANKVKLNLQTEGDYDPDLTNDNGMFIEKQSLSNDKKILEERICVLENQLKVERANQGISERERLDMKRKAENVLDAPLMSNYESVYINEKEEAESLSEESMDDMSEENVELNVFSIEDTENKEWHNVENIAKAGEGQLKKKHRKKKKKSLKIEVTDSDSILTNINDSEEGASRSLSRSYGKPIYRNARKIKEEEKFDKLIDKREFIFQD